MHVRTVVDLGRGSGQQPYLSLRVLSASQKTGLREKEFCYFKSDLYTVYIATETGYFDSNRFDPKKQWFVTL